MAEHAKLERLANKRIEQDRLAAEEEQLEQDKLTTKALCLKQDRLVDGGR